MKMSDRSPLTLMSALHRSGAVMTRRSHSLADWRAAAAPPPPTRTARRAAAAARRSAPTPAFQMLVPACVPLGTSTTPATMPSTMSSARALWQTVRPT